MNFDPRAVYEGTNGEVTKSFYRHMDSISIHGELATALFRAQKRSSAAKKYRGRKYTSAAYEVKDYSIGEICRILTLIDKSDFGPPAPYVWGWKHDPSTPGFEWLLYVMLPQGEVSFHTSERRIGPDYPGEWDGTHLSEQRILAFCDFVLATESFSDEPSALAHARF
jgi:hypothetical protein